MSRGHPIAAVDPLELDRLRVPEAVGFEVVGHRVIRSRSGTPGAFETAQRRAYYRRWSDRIQWALVVSPGRRPS